MKYLKSMGYIVLPLMLSACNAAQSEQEFNAKPVSEKIQESLCPKPGKECSTFTVTRLQYADAPWLTKLLDTHLLNSLHTETVKSDTLIGQMKAVLAKNTEVLEPAPGEDGETEVLYSKIEEKLVPSGQSGQWLGFVSLGHQYNRGAAHGMYAQTNLMVNAATRKFVELDEILLSPQAGDTLSILQRDAWLEWLERNDMVEPGGKPESFLEDWPFQPTDNWRIEKDGLAFTFQPYAICPFSCGMPEIHVPLKVLTDVVKPEVLQAAAQWHGEPPAEAFALEDD